VKKEVLGKIFPFLEWWPGVNRTTLWADAIAGLTGAVIVIPQGVAFAMIAGLPPIYGLYTAMITPIVAGLFGSSRHLISGPTTAISIVVFAAVSTFAEQATPDFIRLALTLAFMAGVFQLALGLARLGTLVNFVSHVVVIGFTAGAAILIAINQLKHVFGVPIPKGATFLETIMAIVSNLPNINWLVFLVAMATLLSAILLKKWFPRFPYLLPAMVIGSVLGWLLGGESSGIMLIGEMPGHLPPFSMPDLNFKTMSQLAPNAFAIALLGLIEAVAIARSIGIKTHQQIDGNQEFIGQGLSNIVGSFFSCYPGSGSFTRSGINFEAGAKTPLAGIFAALLLMLIVLFIAPLTAYLPIATMGGIILLVAYNLIDFKHIKTVLRASKRQSTVLAITFFATLFLDLEFAIYIGVLFSLFFYLRKTSSPHIAVMSIDSGDANRRFVNLERESLPECPQLRIIRIDGSLFFGAVNHVSKEIRELTDPGDYRHLLVVATGINFIDVAGSEMLMNEARRFREKGGGMYFAGLKLIAQDTLIKGGFKNEIGEENFFLSKEEAITEIFKRLDPSMCAICSVRIFKECPHVA
jgi:SulP family sulfate permease